MKFVAFPGESEQRLYVATQLLLVLVFLLCAVFSGFHTTGCEAYSLATDGFGIFNMRANLGACRTHEGGWNGGGWGRGGGEGGSGINN